MERLHLRKTSCTVWSSFEGSDLLSNSLSFVSNSTIAVPFAGVTYKNAGLERCPAPS